MNKKIQALTTRQSLSNFTSRLSLKWQSRTTRTTAEQPHGSTPNENMLSILNYLVSAPTVTGNFEANHDALEYIDQFLRQRGMHIKRLQWNGVETLFATTRRTKKPRIMLAAHLDVVPGAPELFKLHSENGRMYGRGVLDMKFAIAAYLQVIDDIRDTLGDYDIGIMINTDEEVGGLDGAKRMADEGYVPQVLVNPDGRENWAIETFAKGIWWVTLTARGKSAHASRPWEGDSATTKLLAAISNIQKLFPMQGPDTSTYNIGTIQGGKTPNQIPTLATATIDIRFGSSKDDTRLHAAVADICKKADVEHTTEIYSPCFENDCKNPYIKGFADSIETVVGHSGGFMKSYALNDARHYAQYNIPAILFYPPGGGHHSADEWIDNQSFYQVRDVLLDYLNNYARIIGK